MSFRDLMTAVFTALGKQPNIAYVDMPERFRHKVAEGVQSQFECCIHRRMPLS